MDASIPVTRIKPEKLFLNRLPETTSRAFSFCTTLPFFARSKWYLAGGTALALQVGHRQSVYLDFFTPQKNINTVAVERPLFATEKWQTTHSEQGTIYGKLMDAKMSLIAYPFFIPAKPYVRCGNVKMLAPNDIAAMKIIAISQRGRKRDFVDLYWYCTNQEPLADIIRRAVRPYPGQQHNIPHFIKSLAYFADAEKDPMPKIFFNATWDGIRQFFKKEAAKISKEFFRIA